jgi:hypothetical protein
VQLARRSTVKVTLPHLKFLDNDGSLSSYVLPSSQNMTENDD